MYGTTWGVSVEWVLISMAAVAIVLLVVFLIYKLLFDKKKSYRTACTCSAIKKPSTFYR